MALTEAALKKLTEEESIKLALNLQDNCNKTWNVLKRISLNWGKISRNLRPNLLSPSKLTTFCTTKWSKSNRNPESRAILQMWMSRVGIPETALNIFKELGVSIDTCDVEASHRVRPPSRKKVIVKMPSRKNADSAKNADRVRRVKENLNGMKLESLEVDNPIFINDSLCSYYKCLWFKFKRLDQ